MDADALRPRACSGGDVELCGDDLRHAAKRAGQEIVCPCMDDLKVSSLVSERHIGDMRVLCEKALQEGFEFKLTKGHFNQAEIEFLGCICDGQGRRPAPRKVQQLHEWTEPTSSENVVSFLCFFQLPLRVP